MSPWNSATCSTGVRTGLQPTWVESRSICKFVSQYFKFPPSPVYLLSIHCWVSTFIGLFLYHRKYQCCAARPSFAKWECQTANTGKYGVPAVKTFVCQPAKGDCLNSTALLAFTPDSKMGTFSRRKGLPHTFCPISYSFLQYVIFCIFWVRFWINLGGQCKSRILDI